MRILVLALLTAICSAQSVDRIHNLAKAIAKAEGYEKKGTIPNRYNNPGDLKYTRSYRYPGQVGIGKGGHVIFRNPAAGWSALEHQIAKIASGDSKHYRVTMTLRDISRKYAGNWKIWAQNVANNLGCSPSTPLWEILDVPPYDWRLQ